MHQEQYTLQYFWETFPIFEHSISWDKNILLWNKNPYYHPAYIYHPSYLINMQSTSWEMLGWMKHKLESKFPGKYQYPRICRWHHFYDRKQRGTKEPLDEGERGEWKSWIKTQHSENKDYSIQSQHFMANRWDNNGNSERVYFLGLQNNWGWWLQLWN